MAAFAYAGVMYATAVVGGKVVRYKLSPTLARAHRQNRGKAMTEAEAVAFVETKRRARALPRVILLCSRRTRLASVCTRAHDEGSNRWQHQDVSRCEAPR